MRIPSPNTVNGINIPGGLSPAEVGECFDMPTTPALSFDRNGAKGCMILGGDASVLHLFGVKSDIVADLGKGNDPGKGNKTDIAYGTAPVPGGVH